MGIFIRLFFLFYLIAGVTGSAQNTLPDSLLVPGFTVDIRFVDVLDLAHNAVISTARNAVFNTAVNQKKQRRKLQTDATSELKYIFVNTITDFERQILKTDTSARSFSAQFASAYNAFADKDRKDHLLYVYTLRKKPLYDLRLDQAVLSKTFKDAVTRLGRDLSPEGFISRFGTHYTDRVTYGGLFLTRNVISSKDFIHSPYTEEEFKLKVLIAVGQQQRGDSLTDSYINLGPPQRFTKGGAVTEIWDERWEQTVNLENAVAIDAAFVPLTNLLAAKNFPEIEDLTHKRNLLQRAIDSARQKSISWQSADSVSTFFKKYSLQFRQKVITLVKTQVGVEEPSMRSNFIGDLFYGSFSGDHEPMKTRPLIESQGIDLNTLLTDEELKLNTILDFTIAPQELRDAYVSVWDDTKKLVKGNGRTRLFVSGPPEARVYFKDALINTVFKEIEITTIDKDVFKITYSLEQLVNTSNILASGNAFDYSMNSELVAAAARGDVNTLERLYLQGASRNTHGVVKAALQNFEDAEVLNTVFDFGVQPTTEDLDLAFDPDYFSKAKVLALLERGAKPKNNMIYKAVAYQEPEVIYALIREGAIPVNNDVAFAVKLNNYEVTKALMTLDYSGFEADSKMLSLAVASGDTELTKKFITYGAIASPQILKLASASTNSEIIDTIKAVIQNTAQVFEVAAEVNDTDLFNYFVNKARDEVKISKLVLDLSIKNNNPDILKSALKAGGNAEYALLKAIALKNNEAVRVSLLAGATADPVFEYALIQEDATLFSDALNNYHGDPQRAITVAVENDKLAYAQLVFDATHDPLEVNTLLDTAVSNHNLELVELLVSKGANPQTALSASVFSGSVPITQFLIRAGARVEDPELLKKAAQAKNLEMTGLLLKTHTIDPDAIQVDLIGLQDIGLIAQNLSYGAKIDETVLQAAFETNNEQVSLLVLKNAEPELLNETLLVNSIKQEMPQVIRFLVHQLDNPDYALEAAFKYKNTDALQAALAIGAAPTPNQLIAAANSQFNAGIRLLLDSGLNLKATDANGNMLLHFICYHYQTGDEDLIADLVARGLNVNAKNSTGETPLHWAVKAGIENKKSIQKLLLLGALPEARTIKKQSVFDYTDDKEIRQLIKDSMLR